MRHVRRREDVLAMVTHGSRLANVDDGRWEKADPAVTMRLVVPGEEGLAERAAIFDRSEARSAWSVSCSG